MDACSWKILFLIPTMIKYRAGHSRYELRELMRSAGLDWLPRAFLSSCRGVLVGISADVTMRISVWVGPVGTDGGNTAMGATFAILAARSDTYDLSVGAATVQSIYFCLTGCPYARAVATSTRARP